MAEATQEKVQTCRTGRAPLLGRARGGGADAIGNSLCLSVCMPLDSQRAGPLWHRLWVARSLLLI